MPTPWQRALFLPLIILAWLAVLLAAGWLLSHVTKTILVLGLSGIVAYALTPLVCYSHAGCRAAWPLPWPTCWASLCSLGC
jgi:predicted PurR-regulated permease PerM